MKLLAAYLFLITFPTFTLTSQCQERINSFRPTDAMYFPSNTDTTWARTSLSSLGWNENAVQPLLDFLNKTHTKSFMILVNGRIVMENYFNGHTAQTEWEWNSAGKSLVSFTVGIAQQEGLLDINDKVSKYLGNGWSSEALEKEHLITIKNLLSMTSGLDSENQLVIKKNMTYVADAGSKWSYNNVFQLLMKIVANASHQDFDTYFKSKIANKIGMDGFWNNGLIFKIYHSNTRSAARFGLLALNNGQWKNEQIINQTFFHDCTISSQSLNPSYGYLWWLNGKSSYMVPGSDKVFQGYLIPNAPADLYAAMGARDQRIYVIPGKNMVVVRMGEPSNPAHPTFALSGFDKALWEKIDAVIP